MGEMISIAELKYEKSVSLSVAKQFITRVDHHFEEFIKRYNYFGPNEVITGWWMSFIDKNISEKLFEKKRLLKEEVKACVGRSEELNEYFNIVFEASLWYDFKQDYEWLDYDTGIPFPHSFVYLKIAWHNHNGSQSEMFRRYDPYYGKIGKDWAPFDNSLRAVV
ncbi:MAG TPA: hypothetical protein PKW95_05365 [bacterium]|nr:hypothetical protein [bacterium]